MLSTAANIEDLRLMAQRNLPRMVFDYIDGAAGSELTAKRNRQALDDVILLQDVMLDLSKRTTAIELFGQTIAMPMIIGPTGLNGAYWRKGDICLARAAKDAQIPFVMSTVATADLKQLTAAAGPMRWFQLYMLKDRSMAETLLDRIADSGFHVLELTIDTPLPGRRDRDIRNSFTVPFRWTVSNFLNAAIHPRWAFSMLLEGAPTLKLFTEIVGHVPPGKTISEMVQQQFSCSFTWKDIEWLRAHWQGKLVLKGISSAAHVRRSLAAGVDGVVVSNHGGRQLDGSRASIECLPEVAEAAAGRCTVLIDSGFRSGTDVARAIALGADAVQLGRATLFGLAAAGQVGVMHALNILAAEFDKAMALSGATSPADLRGRTLSPPHLHIAAPPSQSFTSPR
ncbi:alpha-hydroxy acid oxidase [Pseudomonas sp. Z18(2022)]|uniref:alpha-hydroxy acid oxidase n=1 Tax=Pseudomonas sp. Z18(2022) TaxID=2983410 RepID=UPI002E814DB9|nr:alpha-hydroxy acid oxidase [Pseudomonas sp. Z18(2022)]